MAAANLLQHNRVTSCKRRATACITRDPCGTRARLAGTGEGVAGNGETVSRGGGPSSGAVRSRRDRPAAGSPCALGSAQRTRVVACGGIFALWAAPPGMVVCIVTPSRAVRPQGEDPRTARGARGRASGRFGPHRPMIWPSALGATQGSPFVSVAQCGSLALPHGG